MYKTSLLFLTLSIATQHVSGMWDNSQRPVISTAGAGIIAGAFVAIGALIYKYARNSNADNAFNTANLLYSQAYEANGQFLNEYTKIAQLNDNDLIDALGKNKHGVYAVRKELSDNLIRLGRFIADLAARQRTFPGITRYDTLARDSNALIIEMKKTESALQILFKKIDYWAPYIDLKKHMDTLNMTMYAAEFTLMDNPGSPENYYSNLHSIIIRKARKIDASNFYPYIDYITSLEHEIKIINEKINAFMHSSCYAENQKIQNIISPAQVYKQKLEQLHKYVVACAGYKEDMERKERALQHDTTLAMENRRTAIAEETLKEKQKENNLKARTLQYNQTVNALCIDGKNISQQYPIVATQIPGFVEYVNTIRGQFEKIQGVVG